MTSFTSGQTLTAAALNAAFGAGWNAGSVTVLGTGLSLTGGTIEATGSAASEWQAGTVLALGAGLTLSASTLIATAAAPQWTAGTVMTVGGGLTVSSNTIAANVTAAVGTVVAGSGLAGGTITSSGTISLGTIAAGDLLGNAGTVAAVPSGVAVGAGLSLSAAGTLSNTLSQGVTELVAGSGLSGGTITGSGTVALETISADSFLANVAGTAAVPAAVPIGGGFTITTGTLNALWNAGTVSTIGSGLTLSSGTLSAGGGSSEWTAGTVTAVATGLTVSAGVLAPDWEAGTVTSVGSGLTLAAGTLSASGTTGVSTIVAGSGLSGGTITSSGTVALQTIAASALLGNVGTVAAVPAAVPIGTGLTVASGTLDALWNAGTVVAVGSGLAVGANTLNAAWNGGTVSALGAGQTLAAGTLSARTSARMQLEWVSGAIVQNDTAWFVYDPPYAGTINSLQYFAGTGTFTAAVQINGTVVTGLSSVAVNSPTTGTAAATAANTFTAGQPITAVITGATSSPTDALLSLNVTWSS